MLLPRLPMRDLDLTDAQRDQIKSIVEKYSSEMEPITEQARASRIALEEAIESNDTAAIETASAAVAKVDLQFALLRAKVRAEVFEQVLTEEQRAKVGEFKARLKGEAKSTRPHRHDSERGLC